MSALTIQNNEVMVGAYSNKEETGYGFIVYLMKRGEIHTEIVSTVPHHRYASKKEAKKIGEDLVEQVKKMDLSSQISGLQKIVGEKESESISEITSE